MSGRGRGGETVGAELDLHLGVRHQVVIPGRVLGCAGVGGEDVERAVVLGLADQRGDQGLAGLGSRRRDEDQRRVAERRRLPAVGPELVDDALIEVAHVAHGAERSGGPGRR